MLQTGANEPISDAKCYPGIARYYDTLAEAKKLNTGGKAFEDKTFYGHDALFPAKLKAKQAADAGDVKLRDDYAKLSWARPS